jgi:hypothetical protein
MNLRNIHKFSLIPVLILGLLVVMFSQLFIPPAKAGNVYNITINIPAMITDNPCAGGEPVALTGALHLTESVTTDSRGGFHLVQTLNTQGLSGQGLVSGKKYTSSQIQEDNFYTQPPFPVVVTNIHHITLQSQTGLANFLFALDLHTTINANGVPTATVDNFRCECKG